MLLYAREYKMMMDFRTPIHMYRMWRPVGGRWVEGETRFPWEEEVQRSDQIKEKRNERVSLK